MASSHNKQFGTKGEDAACLYLIKQKYKIIERNFRTRNGEVDIIAIDTATKPLTLAFIEVKTRISDEFGDPLEAINYYKMQALIRTAAFYAASHPKLPQQLRVDAVGITMTNAGELIDIRLVKSIT